MQHQEISEKKRQVKFKPLHQAPSDDVNIIRKEGQDVTERRMRDWKGSGSMELVNTQRQAGVNGERTRSHVRSFLAQWELATRRARTMVIQRKPEWFLLRVAAATHTQQEAIWTLLCPP